MSEEARVQAEHLARARGRLADAVLSFLASRLALGCPEFRVAQLQDYVVTRELAAPASPDRILRDLRQRGRIDYSVIDRRGSLYRVTRVGDAPQEGAP